MTPTLNPKTKAQNNSYYSKFDNFKLIKTLHNMLSGNFILDLCSFQLTYFINFLVKDLFSIFFHILQAGYFICEILVLDSYCQLSHIKIHGRQTGSNSLQQMKSQLHTQTSIWDLVVIKFSNSIVFDKHIPLLTS